jgi:hypothetical protein
MTPLGVDEGANIMEDLGVNCPADRGVAGVNASAVGGTSCC